MSPKEKADELFNKFYKCPEVQEIESKRCAIIAVESEYHSLREQLFNLKSCGIDIPEKVYLFRIQELIDEEQEVKTEIEAL